MNKYEEIYNDIKSIDNLNNMKEIGEYIDFLTKQMEKNNEAIKKQSK